MRHKTSKIAFIATAFFLLSLYTRPPLGNADPYTDKLKSKAAVTNFIAAILERDVDALLKRSHLPETFQFDKKDKIKKFLKNYFDPIVETRKIEIQSIKIANAREAEAMVWVYRFDRRENIPGTDLKPREETWRFIKGKGSSFPRDQRGKWLFVLE